MQVVHELSFGGAIRYTAGYYKSPLGHDIDGVGVIPDIAISSSEGGTDPQLVLAVETAQNKEKARGTCPVPRTTRDGSLARARVASCN